MPSSRPRPAIAPAQGLVLALALALPAASAAARPAPTAVPPAPAVGPFAPAAGPLPQPRLGQDGAQDDEVAAVLAAERAEADLLRRRGRLRQARRTLEGHLEDDPTDARSRALLARVRLDEGRYERAREEAEQALGDAREAGDLEAQAQAARALSAVQLTVGHYDEALAALEPAPGGARFLDPAARAVDAWALGRALEGTGDREAARRVYGQGAAAVRRDAGWEELFHKGLCEWRLGQLREASQSLVLADRTASKAGGAEPDVLAALAGLYFESEREVEAPGKRSAGALYREALELCPGHEAALVGLFELHRYNRQRVSQSPEEILAQLLSVRPDSIEGLLAQVSADLSDGKLRAVREGLTRVEELAPGRRERHTLEAALAWVEHRREDCEALLAELLRRAPGDSRPEREVGHHLIELYRFAEAVPFLQRAVERDEADWEAWTYLGRALANVGREDEARAALEQAEAQARGRQDAWRNNTAMVLSRMDSEHVTESFGELGFSWQPDAAEVLRRYLVPYYEQAREELAQRYGHTPTATTIEVFRRHQDFSVRSVGFEGFPALGVCFGPVVTALSPLSELRGSFSWARTGFHEFSHVIHLGLSNNRCPRWITEGLATWEEVNRNPTWTRNMRRELVDALANDDLIPVRELNRAFRGPRILFGYYQGGLLCEMLIERHGFPPMIRILEAFDRGLDLDRALAEVFETTPEALDVEFEAWTRERTASLAIEPRWQPGKITRLRLALRGDPPDDAVEREAWAEGWTTVAWGSWQRSRRLDAEEALRQVGRTGLEPVRAQFLKGELALDARREREAERHWRAAVEAGGRDYRALVGLAGLCEAREELEDAERFLGLAESVFPGYDHPEFNAELKLAHLYHRLERPDDEMAALERWLAWNPGEYEVRVKVARWHAASLRWAQAAGLYAEANEIDPFRRTLHVEWADALMALGRWEEALRELEVATLVPPQLDADHVAPHGTEGPASMVAEPMTAEQHAELLRKMADCLRELGRAEEAAAREAEAQTVLDGD